MSDTAQPWQDDSLQPRERAELLVEAMTLEQKIAQLHGAMETVNIYALSNAAFEAGEDLDQLTTQIRIERHVDAIEELGISPASGSPTARSGSAWATGIRARRRPRCR